MRKIIFLALLGLAALIWFKVGHIDLAPQASKWLPEVAKAPATEVLSRQPCLNHTPHKQAFFGDLHVHTGISSDARGRDMLGTVDDAYRFARGLEIGIGPFDQQGEGSRKIQLSVPLDFAAVTDHAEYMAEVLLCTTEGSQAYNSASCATFRGDQFKDGEEEGFFDSMGRAQSLGGWSELATLKSAGRLMPGVAVP